MRWKQKHSDEKVKMKIQKYKNTEKNKKKKHNLDEEKKERNKQTNKRRRDEGNLFHVRKWR